MRRYLKKDVVVALLVFAGALYLITNSTPLFTGQTKPQPPLSNELPGQAKRLITLDSWVEKGDFLPLRVSYQLLAGSPLTQQRFISIGISSVQRQKGNYLIPTLKSIFSQSSPKERSSMVVVVLLADFLASWRATTVTEIKTAFPSELNEGQLVVLHVPAKLYPPLTGLKRNFNDPADRVSFRSKQNVDYAFLMHFNAGVAKYYLQLEDDVSSAKNFISTIRKHIQEQDTKKTNWTMLEFSSLGYIGKLYKSPHLPLLARFLFLFYQEMPCDWLMSHFRLLLSQKDTITLKPSLFQHMGVFSSFRGTLNKLRDKDFEEDLHSNPPADVYSDMSTYQKYFPLLAWEHGKGFFWGHTPVTGNHLTVVYKAPTVVKGIFIKTGTGGNDILESGLVEIGHTVVDTQKGEKTCKNFQPLGRFQDGTFELKEVDKIYDSASSCLRIKVTAEQKGWVIIEKIVLSTNLSTAATQTHL